MASSPPRTSPERQQDFDLDSPMDSPNQRLSGRLSGRSSVRPSMPPRTYVFILFANKKIQPMTKNLQIKLKIFAKKMIKKIGFWCYLLVIFFNKNTTIDQMQIY